MKELESTRMKLWLDVYIAYVSATNATNNDGAYVWADIALKRFDERFKEEEVKQEIGKQQIIQAIADANKSNNRNVSLNPEQYYNETFNK